MPHPSRHIRAEYIKLNYSECNTPMVRNVTMLKVFSEQITLLFRVIYTRFISTTDMNFRNNL